MPLHEVNYVAANDHSNITICMRSYIVFSCSAMHRKEL